MTDTDTLAFKRALEAALPTYLHTCRWYGDKSSEIVAIEWFELGSIALDGARLKNGIISITLADSEQSWYALPVVVDPAPGNLTPITRIQTESGLASICDAIEHPLFAVWLMQLLRDPDHAESNPLGATWSPTIALHHLGGLPNASQSRVSRAEQSN